MSTLVLTHADVARHLNALYLLEDLREAFRSDALARSVAPVRAQAALHAEGAALVLFPGSLPGVPAFTVRVSTRLPGQAPSGVIQLYDLLTGELLAVMDSAHLSAVRAGVVGALAADVLARREAARVALIGTGSQASIHLKCLRLVRSLASVRVFDPDPVRAIEFSTRMFAALSLPTHAAASIAEAVEEADIVVTSTWGREAFLLPERVHPGCHITILGDDQSARCEVSPALLEHSAFICDNRALALRFGAVGGTGLTEASIHAELGEVIAGTRTGRTSDAQITVFGSVGLPFQDLAAAWQVYQAAREDEAVHRVDMAATFT